MYVLLRSYRYWYEDREEDKFLSVFKEKPTLQQLSKVLLGKSLEELDEKKIIMIVNILSGSRCSEDNKDEINLINVKDWFVSKEDRENIIELCNKHK